MALELETNPPGRGQGNETELQTLVSQGHSLDQGLEYLQSSYRVCPNWRFHFTDAVAAEQILASGFRASRAGFWGPGVYAGTTPTPSIFLKLAWGVPLKRRRVPIDPSKAPEFRRVPWPPCTAVCPTPWPVSPPLFK